MRPRLTRAQKDTVVITIGMLVGSLAVLQLWLLTATMNAWMGGDSSIIWPATLASLACFAASVVLLRQLNYLAGDGT